jgi:hypothetical protein
MAVYEYIEKTKQSKLDPFEETLLAMDAAKKSLSVMQQWLASQRVIISCNS